MTDLDQILPLWQELRRTGTEYVLATVVAVEGSGYRKPGARMLIAADGRRAGTISGGCLEGEVARKAFWRTENGPVVRRYSTTAEDGEAPYGMGCGGIIHLLLERRETADPVMERLAESFANRRALAIATVLDGHWIGHRAFWPPKPGHDAGDSVAATLENLAGEGFEEQVSLPRAVRLEEDETAMVHVEWNAARPGLFVFGAGDDAIPLARLARQLGWYVTVADGRSNLATPARFPEAHDVHVLPAGEFPVLELRATDVAVVMTHSLEQDSRILSALLAEELAYIGVLGPRRRTDEILLSLATELDLPESRIDAQMESWLERLHAPMGLDLGGSTPADIALAVIAEIQQCRHRASGLALREIRALGSQQRRVTV
jgi:xanthine/CO dehydrogenase XdhC/CoxF family maturation factor